MPRRGLAGAEDVVLANVRLTSEAKDHELDLVLLLPGVGIAVLVRHQDDTGHGTTFGHARRATSAQ